MPKQSPFKRTHRRRRTFFKEWRLYRELSQDEVADLIGTSKTRVQRREAGLEPYDQPYLEALADALKTDEASLLTRNPAIEDAGNSEILTVWGQAGTDARQAIMAVAKVLTKTGE